MAKATAKDWERLTMSYVRHLQKAERQLAAERKRLDWILKKCPQIWTPDKDGVLHPTYISSRKAVDEASRRDK